MKQHIFFYQLFVVCVGSSHSGLRDSQHKIFYFQVRFRSTQIAKSKRFNLQRFHFYCSEKKEEKN